MKPLNDFWFDAWIGSASGASKEVDRALLTTTCNRSIFRVVNPMVVAAKQSVYEHLKGDDCKVVTEIVRR